MLNISNNKVSKYIYKANYSALENVEQKHSEKVLRRLIYFVFISFLIILFVPWTQNIQSKGGVTTLKPYQKPQNINSVIAGRIETWFVQEGDPVKKGDTILKISEIKDAYFDDELLDRTKDQVNLKKESVLSYEEKIKAQERQIDILKDQRDLKLAQLEIKIAQTNAKVLNDSSAYEAAKINLNTIQYQRQRMDSLYNMGAKSLTDYETRNLKYQEAVVKEIESKNKWINSKNDLFNLYLEKSNIKVKYDADLNKVQSEMLSTISTKLETQTEVSKLQNQYSNYDFRNGLYYILAPQAGYITKVQTGGIGETIKEGETIVSLMPEAYDLAVEVYVNPIDLPLIKIGETVRIQFDGWPAIVFSGWPNASHGTYGGKIYAIDQFISENGKYRILVAPDPNEPNWPSALRFGSGASAMILLNDVPIWYELWRKINGFPPEYYVSKNNLGTQKKK